MKIDDAFPYITMADGRYLFHHATFRDAVNMAKKLVEKDWDSIVILKKENDGTRAIGTVRMQNGRPHWVSKRYDVFNGRVAVPMKPGKKKKKPAPFGL